MDHRNQRAIGGHERWRINVTAQTAATTAISIPINTIA